VGNFRQAMQLLCALGAENKTDIVRKLGLVPLLNAVYFPIARYPVVVDTDLQNFQADFQWFIAASPVVIPVSEDAATQLQLFDWLKLVVPDDVVLTEDDIAAAKAALSSFLFWSSKQYFGDHNPKERIVTAVEKELQQWLQSGNFANFEKNCFGDALVRAEELGRIIIRFAKPIETPDGKVVITVDDLNAEWRRNGLAGIPAERLAGCFREAGVSVQQLRERDGQQKIVLTQAHWSLLQKRMAQNGEEIHGTGRSNCCEAQAGATEKPAGIGTDGVCGTEAQKNLDTQEGS
jgi:hypothetical protein